MQRFFRYLTLAAVAAGSLAPVAAGATPSIFDCDTPSERFSSFRTPIGASVRAAGTLSAVSFRAGKAQPLGGFVINSADGLNSIGFQLVLAAPEAKALDLVLVARNNGKLERRALRAVPLNAAVPFSIVLPANGQGGRFVLGETAINLSFANLTSGNAMAFCSSGQFRFDGLEVVSP